MGYVGKSGEIVVVDIREDALQKLIDVVAKREIDDISISPRTLPFLMLLGD